METSKHSTGQNIGGQLTFLPADSHASPIQSQGNGKEPTMNATSGRKCLELLERFSRLSLWGKTLAVCLIGHGVWFSSKSKLNWKIKATRSNRLYFQLAAKTLGIRGKGFGLQPTLTATDSIGNCRESTQHTGNSLHSVTLIQHLQPTLTASEYKGSCKKRFQGSDELRGDKLSSNLRTHFNSLTHLNPSYAELYMGYPLGWTELNPSEIVSSHK